MAEQLLLVNPRKRKSTRRRRATSRRPVRRRRARRNPIGGLNARGIMRTAKAGVVGAGGAIVVDMAMQRLPLPATLMTSRFLPAVRGLVGIGLGWAVGKFLKQRQLGEELAVGAVTTAAYGVAKNMLGGGAVITDSEVSGYGELLGFEDGLLGLDYFNPGAVESSPFGSDLGYQHSDASDFF